MCTDIAEEPAGAVIRIREMCETNSQITLLSNQKPGLGKMNVCKKCCSTGACEGLLVVHGGLLVVHEGLFGGT